MTVNTDWLLAQLAHTEQVNRRLLELLATDRNIAHTPNTSTHELIAQLELTDLVDQPAPLLERRTRTHWHLYNAESDSYRMTLTSNDCRNIDAARERMAPYGGDGWDVTERTVEWWTTSTFDCVTD